MAVGDAYVFPGFLALVLTQLFFQGHRQLFSHVSEVRGKITPKESLPQPRIKLTTHESDRLTTEPSAKVMSENEKILVTNKRMQVTIFCHFLLYVRKVL